MALRLSAKVVGLDKAKERLRGLPKVLRNRALRAGFRKIGQLLAKDLKRSIPGAGRKNIAIKGSGASRGVRSGATKKSIGFKVKLYRTSGNIAVSVGPRSGFSTFIVTNRVGPQGRDAKGRFQQRIGQNGRQHNPARVFHFLDRGKAGIAPRNYLRTTVARNRGQLMGLLMEEVRKVVAKWQLTQSGS